MKKILLLLLSILLLASCTQIKDEDKLPDESEQTEDENEQRNEDEQTEDENNLVVEKKDNNKPYIYSETNSDYVLESLLKNREDFEEIKNALFDKRVNPKNFILDYQNSKPVVYRIDTIRINIDSNDALLLETDLKDKTNSALNVAKTAKNDLENNNYLFQWESFELYKFYETKDTLSFLINRSFIYWGSESQTEFEAYVIDKKDGSLLDNSRILKYLGKNEDEIVKMIESKFVEMNASGKNPNGYSYEYNNEMVDNSTDIDYSTLFFRIQTDQTYAIDTNSLIVILEAFNSMSGDYSSPYLLSLNLSN